LTEIKQELVAGAVDVDAKSILDAFMVWQAPTITKNSKFATVDPAWDGVSDPKVTFDGESLLTQKGYKYLVKPTAGTRVVMEPIGNSWVISGPLTGSTAAPRCVHAWTASAVAFSGSKTVGPHEVCRVDVPDPGWPYRLYCIGEAIWTHSTLGGWYLRAWLDVMKTGAPASHWGPFVTSGQGQWSCFASDRNLPVEPITGSHIVILGLDQIDAGSPLTSVIGSAFGGLTVFMVPA